MKSVRRGEMSVHRAGSYYGVPHSTLEYKVKERNLSRPRKYQDCIESSSPESGSFKKSTFKYQMTSLSTSQMMLASC